MLAIRAPRWWWGGLLGAMGCPTVTPPPTLDDDAPSVATAADTASTETADTAQDGGPVCPTCEWSVGAWLECSVSCGPIEGEQSRTVACVTAEGEPTNVANCDSAAEPEAVRACLAEDPCAWVTDAFSACSVTCGEGAQTRDVRCEDPAGAIVDGAWCDAATQPVAQQPCEATADCGWVESGFGACSNLCGNGQQSQTVTCEDPSGLLVEDRFCTDPAPLAVVGCLETSACAWSTGSWSACTATCQGDSGTQDRDVDCIDTAGGDVSDLWCSAAGPPPSTQQTCSGTQANVAWTTGPWSVCDDLTCTQTRDVTCPSGCCSGAAPVSLQFCPGAYCYDPCNYSGTILCP